MNGTSTQSMVPAPSYALPSGPKLLGDAFRFYLAHWRVVAGIAVIPVLFSFPRIFLAGKAPVLDVFFIIFALVAVALSRIALFDAIAEGGEPAGGVTGAFGRGFHFLVPFAWVSALVSVATFGGFVLLVIPGLLLSVWLSLSLYALLVENYRGTSALVASWHYVRGYWLSVLGRSVFFGFVFLLLGFAVGLLVAGPSIVNIAKTGGAGEPAFSEIGKLLDTLLTNLVIVLLGIIYSYLIYRSLREIKASVPMETDAPKLKQAVTAFMVLGIVGLVAVIALAGFLLAKFLPQFLQQGSPAALNLPVSSLTASLTASTGFSPLVHLLSFWR